MAHLVLISLVLASTPDDQATRARALAAFKANRIAEACDLYTTAAGQSPDDAENWSDLGLCNAKQGRKDAARKADLKAVMVAKDKATRLHAYYNLYKLGDALPHPPDDGCVTWPGVDKGLMACTSRCTDHAAHPNDYTGIFFCPVVRLRDGGTDDPTPPNLDDGCALSAPSDCFQLDEDVSGYQRINNESLDTELVETSETCTYVVADDVHHRVGAYCLRTEDGRKQKGRAIEITCSDSDGCHQAHPDWSTETSVAPAPAPRPAPAAGGKLTCTGEEKLNADDAAIFKTFRDYQENVDFFYLFPLKAFGRPLSCKMTFDAENSRRGNVPIDPADFWGTLHYEFPQGVAVDFETNGMARMTLSAPNGFPDEKGALADFATRAGFSFATHTPQVEKKPASGTVETTYSDDSVDAEGTTTYAIIVTRNKKVVGLKLH